MGFLRKWPYGGNEFHGSESILIDGVPQVYTDTEEQDFRNFIDGFIEKFQQKTLEEFETEAQSKGAESTGPAPTDS
jgi:hypothetical protein